MKKSGRVCDQLFLYAIDIIRGPLVSLIDWPKSLTVAHASGVKSSSAVMYVVAALVLGKKCSEQISDQLFSMQLVSLECPVSHLMNDVKICRLPRHSYEIHPYDTPGALTSIGCWLSADSFRGMFPLLEFVHSVY